MLKIWNRYETHSEICSSQDKFFEVNIDSTKYINILQSDEINSILLKGWILNEIMIKHK